jgi:hypothetical protein
MLINIRPQSSPKKYTTLEAIRILKYVGGVDSLRFARVCFE